jgi:hypothetical protein
VTTVILVRWHHNVQAYPPTAIIHIPLLTRTGRESRLSTMGLQDTQRALKQQINIRLPTSHTVRMASDHHHHHQQR